MRTLKTSEAASMLNVSANTLRAWERRFGYPMPQRTAGKHRVYVHGEVAALRDALRDGLSISSAVSRARESLRSDTHILVGALAIPLAAMAAAGAGAPPAWLVVWNALGALDLIVAVSLGVLSAPGTPFRVFTAEPGTVAMTAVPWIIVPALLVPLYLLIHLTIAAKLRSLQRTPQVVALAGEV